VRFRAGALDDVVVFESEAHADDRGYFVRTLDADVLRDAGLDHRTFAEESQSRSRGGVVRGLHGRKHLSEGKLVRCARGAIFEILVDLRPWSSTFLQHDTIVLDDVDHRQVWVPPGFVHGFAVLSDFADVCYHMDAPHVPGLDLAIAWDDPDLALPWPVTDPVLSERDRSAPLLAAVRAELPRWFGGQPPSSTPTG